MMSRREARNVARGTRRSLPKAHPPPPRNHLVMMLPARGHDCWLKGSQIATPVLNSGIG
jgi:hypothetical protein